MKHYMLFRETRGMYEKQNGKTVKTKTQSYKELTEKFIRGSKLNSTDKLYFTYIIDMITLMTNVHCDIHKTLGDEWQWFDGFFKVRYAGARERENVQVVIPVSIDELKNEYVKAMQAITSDNSVDKHVKGGMRLIGEGLFFAAWLFMVVCKEKSVPHYVKRGKINITLNDLNTHNICYYYFQWFDVFDLIHIKMLREMIQELGLFDDDQSLWDQLVIGNSIFLQNLKQQRFFTSTTSRTRSGGMYMDYPIRENENADDTLIHTLMKNESMRIPYADLPNKTKDLVLHESKVAVRPNNVATNSVVVPTVQVEVAAGGKKKSKQTGDKKTH
jgi:hypothetical protein